MNLLLPLIILVLLAVIWAASLNNPQMRLYVVIGILVMILTLCWLQSNNIRISYNNSNSVSNNNLENFEVSGYAPLGYTLRVNDGNVEKANSVGCDGYNYMDINSQISPMGTYDGLVLPSSIPVKPLMKNVFINSPVGDDIKLTQDPASKNFPTVDGLPNSDKHLFTFANNQVSWDCCPSPYGTDSGRGCVCLSQEQLDMFRQRGANKRGMVEYPDI